MKFRETIILLSLALLTFVLIATSALAEGPFKLRPGAKGKLCLTCHTAFSAKMDAKYIHTPLAEGDCSSCHNPHASEHGNLMSGDADSVCYRCHDAMVPESAISSHQVVADGQCVSCHDPHSSDNTANLIKEGNELCFDCHKDLGEKIRSNKFGHAPVEQSCLRCHNPHAAENSSNLLIQDEPALCLECHKASSDSFKKQHLNYPVEQGRCTVCHDPHGSNAGAILADNVHEPIKNGMCNQCHNAPDSPDPFAVTKEGFELCQGCHYEMVNDTFGKNRLHWPVADKVGCVNCHTPHASKEPALLKASMISVCGDCHADTLARQERSQTKHQPISSGECVVCHSPHASDNLFLQVEDSTIETCGQCHDWQTHSTHPIGSEVVDPRNPNVCLDCLSCHRTHGTEYKHFLYYPDVQSLCVQCHSKYRR